MFKIKVEELTHKYPDGTQALNGANIDVRDGEFLAVLGANGSGKTTLRSEERRVGKECRSRWSPYH